jgi:hypothetical protein
MTVLLMIVLAILASVAAMVALVVTCIWLAVRGVRRSRTFNRGTLLVRTATAPNRASREIGRLRITLFDSIDATGRVLTGVPAPSVLGDLARDLHRSAAITDQRLGLLAIEPDRALLDRLLPQLRTVVAGLARASAELRGTAWQFATELDEPRSRALTLEVADQIAGLRAGLAEVQAIRASILYPL